MEKQIKLFLEFLENDKRVSKNTLESYRRDIMQYADYIEENHMNYTKIDNEEIEEYLVQHDIPYYVRKAKGYWLVKYDKEAL